MKKHIILGAALVLMATGCSTPSTTLAPVGPDPAGFTTGSKDGQLEVFSALSARIEGNNPTWYQHSDYRVFDQNGRKLEQVDNSNGYYSRSPHVITLPPGEYQVVARAKGILRVRVPVMIKAGQLTAVHLDGRWQPAGVETGKLVSVAGGYPVGWSTGTRQ